VDLGLLRQNADLVSALVGPKVGLLAVVKADAYGHGALACARALEKKVFGFGVSLVEEGVELRRGGIEAPIVVLGSFYGLSHRDVVAYRLTPVVSDVADLERFARAADELASPRVPFHLKIDTGMSRLGIRPEGVGDFVDRARRISGVELTGICTHLGEADGDDGAFALAQLARFDEVRAGLAAGGVRPALAHAANSAALVRFPEARYDLVRPGLLLYGHAPAHAALAGLRPVLSLRSRIVSLRQVPAGTRISYAGLFTTARATTVATVPVGYADGYSRRLSGRAEVLVAGRRAAVLGAITMDMMMVDVTGLSAQLGDEVVLLGAQGQERISAEDLAAWSGTIPWEIFCGVSKRVPRVYVGERA
jgi:alanine racemase